MTLGEVIQGVVDPGELVVGEMSTIGVVVCYRFKALARTCT